ncbi:hypothetical protein BDV30DRAFT_251166 [Aspergillus minisclerotigenes]|uniref:Rhodopsin domain-containing protein n=1 Tax=Aspergillus minisclerotigenes TaxID=656917 RepID=A0A5N6JFF5_9EURO|nr:hypothetical protein BDV30DRAFT_251166 [Aspergillus minisclerotigenes]
MGDTTTPSNGENRQWVIKVAAWPLFSVCTVLVALRIWTRARVIRPLGWDDAFIVLSMACATVESVLSTISVHYGTGRHTTELSETQCILSGKFNWMSQGFHVMATNWGKTSVALFLLRIMRKVKHHQIVIYGGITFLTIINTMALYTMYGQCTPTEKLWDNKIEGSCWSPTVQKNYAFFQGSASAFSDFALAIYPLRTIAGLQMPRKVKIGLSCVLSLGIVAMAAAIVKTINLSSLTERADLTWDTVDLSIWTSIEQYLIILAACIPTMTPLVNILLHKRPSKQNTARARTNPGNQYGRGQGYAQFGGRSLDYALGTYGDAWTTALRDKGDGDSEDPIMDEETSQGIMKTTEIHIQSDVNVDQRGS